jgi:hypothetical protein
MVKFSKCCEHNNYFYASILPLFSVAVFLCTLIVTQLLTVTSSISTIVPGKGISLKNFDHVISTTNDGHYSKTFIFPHQSSSFPPVDQSATLLGSEVPIGSGNTSITTNNSSNKQTSRASFFQASYYNLIKRKIISTFIPSHYLSPLPSQKIAQSDFIRFSFYSAIQDLSTSLRSVLATQRVLEGIGVGRVGATLSAASLNFIVRDGVGMVRDKEIHGDYS